MRALLVEDDVMIGEAVQAALREASYAADWVKDGLSAIAALRVQRYDIVLLDLGIPGRDGLGVLGVVRSMGDSVPLVIISARDSLEDRLRGLDGGADDFVLKPFEMAELLARMRAVIRRKAGSGIPILSNGKVWLDPASRQAAADGQLPVQLSNREFSLLHGLMVRPGAILSKTELEDRVYGWNEEVEGGAIDFLIHALRKKLGSAVIKNIRGVGWMVPKED